MDVDLEPNGAEGVAARQVQARAVEYCATCSGKHVHIGVLLEPELLHMRAFRSVSASAEAVDVQEGVFMHFVRLSSCDVRRRVVEGEDTCVLREPEDVLLVGEA